MFWNWVKDQVENDKLFFTIKNKQTKQTATKKPQQNKQTHKPKQTKIKTITLQI